MAIAAGEIYPGRELVQIFRCPKNWMSHISILMATYGRTNKSSFSISLYRIEGAQGLADLGGNTSAVQIANMSDSAAVVADNERFDFYMSPVPGSAGRVFILKISSLDGNPGDSLTVWLENHESERIQGHVICLSGSEDRNDFGIQAQIGFSPPEADTPVPKHLLFSPVSQCNFGCVHCISKDTRKQAERLKLTVRAEIQRWANQGFVTHVRSDYSGDIFWADDRYGGELDYLISLGTSLSFDTNGTHITEARARKVLTNARVIHLNFSLDAATTPTLKKVRKGAPSIDIILDNIRTVVRLKRELDVPVELSLGFTMTTQNIHELYSFVQLSDDIGVPIIYARHVEVYDAKNAHISLWNSKDLANASVDEACRLADSLGVELRLSERRLLSQPSRLGHGPCNEPWHTAVVTGTGDVQVCCVPKTKIGNLHEQSMEEIWNGERYRKFRQLVNSPTPPEVCAACPMIRRLGNEDSYLPYKSNKKWVEPYLW